AAAALRHAARPGHAPRVDDPGRAVPLRSPGAARSARRLAHGRPAPPSLARWRCVDTQRGATHGRVRLREQDSGAERVVSARALVNAAGPWAGQFLAELAHVPQP